jgi:hypothetical protein
MLRLYENCGVIGLLAPLSNTGLEGLVGLTQRSNGQ